MGRSCYQANLLNVHRGAGLFVLACLLLAAGCQKKSPADEHIRVVMKKYTIEPAVIRVKAGERVELEITTADVQHGLDIPALGIKEPIQPGKTTVINFKAPVKGEYNMACGVICGPHHDDMVGKLVVE
jgi:heme/copper-type cytochrome/quinol oxidase subunit 2